MVYGFLIARTCAIGQRTQVAKMPSDGKIKSKDLSYESTLPPFLQRLHAQKAGRGDEDRHERPVARPKRAKANAEDDEPTVVDESGETLSKEELERMTSAASGEVEEGGNVKGGVEGEPEPKASGALPDDEVKRGEQKVTDGTAMKKRKVAKVVGEGADDANGEEGALTKDDPGATKAAKKIKKKAKPIKLAFDDEDENGT